MRKYPKIVSALAVCLMFTTACSNDEDGRPPGAGQVSPQAQSTFESLFPGARDVEWEVRGTYAVADFSYSDADGGGWVPGSAWFNQSDGAWLMSEYDVRFDRLPDMVKTAFQASEYATWRVDDVDLIRREGVTLLYVIEVENAGQEMDLYYTEDGVLVKAVADGGGQSDYDGLIPSTPGGSVMDFIRSHYPDARIVEVDTDDGLTEVELVDAGRVLREVVFDRSGAWLYTQTEVRRADLPAAVVAAWDSSEYAETNGYRLDDIDFFETANDGSYYRLELDSRFGDVKLRVTPDGQLSLYQSAGGGAIVGGKVEAFVSQQYPGAVIVEKDYDDGYLEVEIRHEGREKEVLFDGRNNWVLTRWDVSYRDLPEAVVEAFRQSDYARWEVDDIYYAETPSGEWYVFEVEDDRTDRERLVRITPQGSFVNA